MRSLQTLMVLVCSQLELSPGLHYINTFSTHVGLRWYKRLNFGVTSAAEIFQNTIRETLEGIPGVKNISDDILIYGRTQDEHDDSLKATFKQLSEKNLTLNTSKCSFNKSSLEYFGYVFSDKGVSPDPKKVEAIKNAKAPASPVEVRSLVGTTVVDLYLTLPQLHNNYVT